jgi:hypothetical protein
MIEMKKAFTAPASARASSGQIALWMLTKMAMVFFILALALVLIGLSNKEKSGLCTARADSVVQNVRSQVVGVVNAPIEDELKVIPLERVLATGSEDFQRYNLTVTWRKDRTGKQTLVFEANAVSKQCSAGSSMAVSGVQVHLAPAVQKNSAFVLTSEPSKKYGETPPPSLYLIVLKCAKKEWPSTKHLFVEDCWRELPSECLSFDSQSSQVIKNCCGWVSQGGVPADCPPGLS